MDNQNSGTLLADEMVTIEMLEVPAPRIIEGTMSPLNLIQPTSDGKIEQPKHAGGRPTKYSQEMLIKTQGYFLKCNGKIDGKKRMPFIEELALELDVSEDTIVEWKNKLNEDGSLLYPEFSAAYSRIFLLQKLRLKQTGLNGKNQSFVIFLLNSNHGMVSAEKQIFAGERDEPLRIEIVEEKALGN